jgi:tRNA nucleotidyltransferase/poly(A) polymerase
MTHSLLPSEPYLREVCFALQSRPEPVYLVGGYVRDYLMGRASHDLDFAVQGDAIRLAREIADAFGASFIPLDQEHDTGRALFQRGGQVDYVDFARVRGQSILDDLAARDFTINAIAISVRDLDCDPPRWLDPLRGLEDIRARVIRATSDRVFLDDPLRMLRAIRQAARLGFSLSPDTEALISRDASLIGRVSFERVRDELAQIIASSEASSHLMRLASLGLLFCILPELETGFEQALRNLDKAERFLDILSGCSTPGDLTESAIAEAFFAFRARLAEHFSQLLSDERDRALIFRMGALFAGDAMPILRFDQQSVSALLQEGEETLCRRAEQAALASQRLRFSKRESQLLSEEIGALGQFQKLVFQDAVDGRDLYRFFAQHGIGGVDVLCLSVIVAWADGLPDRECAIWSRWLAAARWLVRYYVQEWPKIQSLPRLVSGNDLMRELKLKPGPLLGELLEKVREAQAVGEIGSPEAALAWASVHMPAGTGENTGF